MSKLFLGDSKCYISALLGSDMLLRVDEGNLRQVEMRPIYDIDPMEYYHHSEFEFFRPIPLKIIGCDLTLNIRTGPAAYTITRFDDGLASMPISDKRVGDCEVEELLYAIQKKMGIV